MLAAFLPALASLFFLSILFALQNILLLTRNSLEFFCMALWATEFFGSSCALYFSIRAVEAQRRAKIRHLFAKIFSLSFFYSAAILLNLDFNLIGALTSIFCAVMIFASVLCLALSFVFGKKNFVVEKADMTRGGFGGFDRLNHRVADDCELFDNRNLPDMFSKREKEVAALLLQGKTTQETADSHFISPATVKTHIQHIYEKGECGTGRNLRSLWGKWEKINNVTSSFFFP